MNAVVMERQPIQTSLVPEAPAEDSSPAGMIAYAMRTNASIADLRELYAFKKEWEADEAKKAFQRAMAAFKESPPTIGRDKENKQFGSRYSSLGNTVNKTNEALASHGLNATWELSQDENLITVTCILTHEQGHSERVTFSAPPDGSGSKNPIQQMKSTVTYLRGVTFEAVTGVVTSEAGINADDDGNGAGDPDAAISAPLYDKIELAQSVDELKKLKPDIEAAKVQPATRRNLIGAYNAKHKKLKGETA